MGPPNSPVIPDCMLPELVFRADKLRYVDSWIRHVRAQKFVCAFPNGEEREDRFEEESTESSTTVCDDDIPLFSRPAESTLSTHSLTHLDGPSMAFYYSDLDNISPFSRHEILVFFKVVRNCSIGLGILPSSIEEELMPHASYLGIEPHMFSSQLRLLSHFPDRGWKPPAYFHQHVLRIVREIRHAAQDCVTNGNYHDTERWHKQVYARLFEVALQHNNCRGIVDLELAKGARIQPNHLMVMDPFSPAMRAQLVEYALCVRPHESDLHRIQRILLDEDVHATDLNQHTFWFTQYHPLGASILASPALVDRGVIRDHLLSMATSHFKRLRQIVGPTLRLPVLPMIHISIHRWRFYVATESSMSVTLFDALEFGGTDSIVEIYKIIDALQLLTEWIDRVYKPWIFRHVLN